MHVPMILVAALTALAVGVVAVRLALALAERLRYQSVAGSEAHKIQARNVPYGGGLGMAAAFAVAVVLGQLLGAATILPGEVAPNHGPMWGIYAGAAIMLALGALDDLRSLPARPKLAVQMAAAALAVWGSELPVDSLQRWSPLGYIVAWLWLVLITNAFNLLDHADGLSASVAAVCACVILGGAFMAGDVQLALPMACLVAVLVGFLVWNRPPARIYMGDAGALPLGFLIGAGTLSVTFWPAASGTGSWLAIFTPVVITAIPLFDTAAVVVKRLRRGKPIMKGDRNHIGHRLGRLGLSPFASLAVVVALQVALAGSVIQLRHGDLTAGVMALLQDAAILVAVLLLETTRDHG